MQQLYNYPPKLPLNVADWTCHYKFPRLPLHGATKLELKHLDWISSLQAATLTAKAYLRRKLVASSMEKAKKHIVIFCQHPDDDMELAAMRDFAIKQNWLRPKWHIHITVVVFSAGEENSLKIPAYMRVRELFHAMRMVHENIGEGYGVLPFRIVTDKTPDYDGTDGRIRALIDSLKPDMIFYMAHNLGKTFDVENTNQRREYQFSHDLHGQQMQEVLASYGNVPQYSYYLPGSAILGGNALLFDATGRLDGILFAISHPSQRFSLGFCLTRKMWNAKIVRDEKLGSVFASEQKEIEIVEAIQPVSTTSKHSKTEFFGFHGLLFDDLG